MARRLSAVVALVMPVLAALAAVLGLWGDVARLLVATGVLLLIVLAAWYSLTRRAARRLAGVGVLAALVVVEMVLVAGAGHHGLMLVVLAVFLVAGLVAARMALGGTSDAPRSAPGVLVGPASHGVLIMNLVSGGGKAERLGLSHEARRRGIEPIVLREGDDLRQLAIDAVERGADVIGMAGGDGSQALVASVASELGVAHVCVPAGTRNHFALDLGLDRADVVGALDAFADGVERRVDLATINGQVFVNTVSLGVYAEIVQSEHYRDAKHRTTMAMLPDLLGPDAPPFDLHFEHPDGRTVDGAQVIQVSNNPYVLTRLSGGFGTRAKLDSGMLGIAAVRITRDGDVARFVALESAGRLSSFVGWMEWEAPRFVVHSASPVAAGVDGEAHLIDPPLVFEIRPAAVRVRIPAYASGRSPAAIRSERSLDTTVRALVDLARGRSRG